MGDLAVVFPCREEDLRGGGETGGVVIAVPQGDREAQGGRGGAPRSPGDHLTKIE